MPEPTEQTSSPMMPRCFPAGNAGGLDQVTICFPVDSRGLRNGIASWLAVTLLFLCGSTADAQVRMKRQDRGRYQPPKMAWSASNPTLGDAEPAEQKGTANRLRPASTDQIATVGFAEPVIVDDGMGELPPPGSWSGEVFDATCGVEPTCGIAPICDCLGEHTCGVEGPLGCDSFAGCGSCGSSDSCFGCGGCGRCGDCRCEGYLGCNPDRWFASAEVLLWWQKKQTLPPLVSRTDDPATVFNAGNFLYGNQDVLDDVTAGGRFQLGMWVDGRRCQSIVGRVWGLGRESYGFSTNSSENPVIVRPFIDPNDLAGANNGQTGLLITGNGQTGNIAIQGESEVYGADISLRQLWRQGLGGRIDFLYGYQHMRLNESLMINSRTISAPPAAAPTIDRLDLFDVENEFHGGQIGFAGRFREGPWSWDGMVKLGFGSLRRGANLVGQTITRDDRVAPPNNVAITPTGLLVQNSNSGNSNDNTFAWSPEVNLGLVYHTGYNADLSVGYGVVVMTDALRVSDAIDQDLQVDVGNPQTVDRPNRGFRYDDYWVQGIQFGLDWWY